MDVPELKELTATCMNNEIVLEKHEDWTRSNPVWRVLFPVSIENQKIVVPELDLPVTPEYTMASVTIVGKNHAQRVVTRLKEMLADL